MEFNGIKWLVGWRGIAKHLDCNWETVRKWHMKDPLPIQRIGTNIIADPSLIERWIKARLNMSTPKHT